LKRSWAKNLGDRAAAVGAFRLAAGVGMVAAGTDA